MVGSIRMGLARDSVAIRLLSLCSVVATEATEFGVPWTCDEVIIHHAGRLHKRITDRRADEFESASQQVTAHGVGFSSARGYVSQGAPTILHRGAANKTPEISIETSE